MMDVRAPNGEIANRRTAPIPMGEYPVPYIIGVLSERYPNASICPDPIQEGDTTYRIYYHVPVVAH